LQDRLNEIYSFPSAIIDNDGNILTATAWQDVCTKFHRKNKECERDCKKSDKYILSHLHEADPAVSYRCPRGLVDNATPIIIDGVHYGNFFTGQFFLEEPDLEFFKKQAKQYGFDEKVYLKAVKKVPVWSQKQLDNYLFFIKGLIEVISTSGLKKLREIEAREKIEETEQRASTILSQMLDGFWMLDRKNGGIIDVNHAMCEMLGYTRDELLKMSVADVTADDSPKEVRQRIQQIIRNGSLRFQSRFRRKDGMVVDAEISVTYLPESNVFFGFHRDITQRKKMEQDLLASEMRYRTLFEQSPDGIVILNPKTAQPVEFNDQVCRQLGYTRDEFGKLTLKDIEVVETIEESLTHFQRIMHEGRDDFDTRHRTKQGEIRDVHVTAQLLDAGGHPIYHCIWRDITERKRAETALRESEEKFAKVFQDAPVLISISDLANGNYIDVNEEALRVSGFSRDEVIGHRAVEIGWITLEDRARLVEETQAHGKIDGIEMRFRTKNGDIVIGLVKGERISIAGRDCLLTVTVDITQRKQVEKTLLESEERYRTLVETAGDVILMTDLQGRHIFRNSAYYTSLGFDVGEDVELEGFARVHPDDHSFVRSGMAELLQKGESSGEYRVQHKNGHWLHRYNKSKIIRDEAGQAHAILSIIRDITERKQAEETLRLQGLVLDQIHDRVTVTDLEGRITYVNDAECIMLKRSRDELIGQSVISYGDDPHRGTAQSDIIQTTLSQGEWRGEVVNYAADGTELILDSRVQLVRDATGKPIAMCGITTDITERKRAEEALHRNEAYLRGVLANSPDTVYTFDLSSGKIAFLSRETFCGYSRSELEGPNSILFAVHPEDLTTVKEAWRQIRAGLMAVPIEYRLQKKDGILEWIEQRVAFLSCNLDGSPREIIVILNIATERKQAEEKLRISEEKFSRIFQFSPALMAISSLHDGRFTNVNDTFLDTLGFERQDVIGKTSVELGLFVDPQQRDQAVHIMLENGSLRNFEILIRAKNGKNRVGLFSGVPLQLQDQQFLLTIMNDITERKKAEEKLRASEERYRILFNHLPIPAFTKDIDGKYTSCNEENMKYWVVNPIAHTDAELLPHEAAAALYQADRQVMNSKTALTVEEALIDTPLGNRLFWTRKVPLLDGNGNVTGILGAGLDITERKQAEQRIKIQLEHLNALHTIDTVISSSFDLRTTLEIFLEEVTAQLKVDAASILLLNKHALSLERAASRGFRSDAVRHPTLHVNNGYPGQAVLQRKIIHVPNLAEVDTELVNSLQLGNKRFTTYFAIPLIAKGEVVGVLEILHRSPLDPEPEWRNFLQTLAEQAAIAIDNAHLLENLQRSNFDLTLAYDATIEGWSRAMDLRDRKTEGHTQRVTELTMKLARAMNISPDELIHIRRGALLHDIGKLGVPDSILFKPGELKDDEWKIMQQHPHYAYDMLVSIAYLKPALDIPWCHHEKWDGTGYPRGLKGEEIPMAARIFAVVDVWDALITDRPYRTAWSMENAMDYIRQQSGKYFDSKVVEVFLKL
jgi:PAS domain S-box-containing protein